MLICAFNAYGRNLNTDKLNVSLLIYTASSWNSIFNSKSATPFSSNIESLKCLVILDCFKDSILFSADAADRKTR